MHIFGGVAHAFTNPDADDESNGLKYNRDAMHMSWKIMRNYFNRYIYIDKHNCNKHERERERE